MLSYASEIRFIAAGVKVEGRPVNTLSLQSQSDSEEDGIQDGVCNVILDYQNEIENLMTVVAHETALCDKIEAYKNRIIKQ